MDIINELIKQYQQEIENIDIEITNLDKSIPKLNLDSDILLQLDNQKLQQLETLSLKLDLTDEERNFTKEVFAFFKHNQDLNFQNLIIKDASLENFTNFIKNIYLKILNYQELENKKNTLHKEKNIDLITKLTKILELLQNNIRIDINPVIDLLKVIPLNKESILKIVKLVLEHNLQIYKKIKEQQEEPSQEELIKIVTEDKKQDEYTEMIDTYIRKINYIIDSLRRDDNYQDEKYLYLSNLTKLLNELKDEKSYYEVVLEDESYQAGIEDIRNRILEIVDSIEFEIDNYEAFIKTNQEIDLTSGRDLIIISPSVKDLDQFKKSVCTFDNIKNMYKMLVKLKNEEIVYGMPVFIAKSQIPVKKLKVPRSTGGTPRLFYQMIGNTAIVLMLGIEGRKDYTFFKQSIEGRIKSLEYRNIIEAIRLGTTKPLETSPSDDKITNKEYLDNLLLHYKNVESEFFKTFHKECYNPSDNVR